MKNSESQRTGPEIITFGCRLNAYESEVIRDHARNAGLNDAVIINTCAVTAEAERQARQVIRRVRRTHPDTPIIVTGCASQIDPIGYGAMPEVTRVLGNLDKLNPESFSNPKAQRIQVSDIMSADNATGHLIAGFNGRARAFVQVQQGCDHRCTFCTIPFGRGPSRSIPIGVIVEQVRELVKNGHIEVVLTGVDITDYGKGLPGQPSLGQLVRRLLSLVPELKRLRLSSLDCVEIDAELIRLIGSEERLMPHLHLSVQAGNDLVLKRMKRRHNRRDVIQICRLVRSVRPDVVFGADLIAGFPTENEDMFLQTLDLIDQCDLTWLHVFPYSERPGTPAALMPKVPVAVRRERAALLRKMGEDAEDRFLQSCVGNTANILIEQNGAGRTEHFALARLDQLEGKQSTGPVSRVEVAHIVGIEGRTLKAKSIDQITP